MITINHSDRNEKERVCLYTGFPIGVPLTLLHSHSPVPLIPDLYHITHGWVAYIYQHNEQRRMADGTGSLAQIGLAVPATGNATIVRIISTANERVTELIKDSFRMSEAPEVPSIQHPFNRRN